MEKLFDAPYNSVYIKSHQTAKHLGFKIYKEDMLAGTILFKVGMSLWSFGEDFKISIESKGKTKTKVTMSSESSVAVQGFDWGKNDENITEFFNVLTTSIEQ